MRTLTKILTGLTPLLVVLKLFTVINWSWWLVLSPLWLMVAMGVVWIVVKEDEEWRGNERYAKN